MWPFKPKLGSKEPAKTDTADSKSARFYAEPDGNMFRKTWGIWVMFIVIFAIMMATAHWDKVAPIWNKIASIFPH